MFDPARHNEMAVSLGGFDQADSGRQDGSMAAIRTDLPGVAATENLGLVGRLILRECTDAHD